MNKVNSALKAIDARFPQNPEAIKKRRNFIYKPLATAALLGVLTGGAVAAGNGLRLIDEATQRTVDSVSETVGQNENYITLAKRAVIDLGLDPDSFNAVRIGQEVTGDSTPQPGQQVTFDEVQHWYGTTSVEGHTEDTDN